MINEDLCSHWRASRHTLQVGDEWAQLSLEVMVCGGSLLVCRAANTWFAVTLKNFTKSPFLTKTWMLESYFAFAKIKMCKDGELVPSPLLDPSYPLESLDHKLDWYTLWSWLNTWRSACRRPLIDPPELMPILFQALFRPIILHISSLKQIGRTSKTCPYPWFICAPLTLGYK